MAKNTLSDSGAFFDDDVKIAYFMLRQKVITYWVSAIVSYILTLPLSHYAD